MQTVIFCGGKGTRMKEETEWRPKPMVEVGGRPILWHIMKIYAHYGHNEFILPLGYKGDMIKNYFLNHNVLANDFTYTAASNRTYFHDKKMDDLKITFADTGFECLTGERLLKVSKHIKGDNFMVTYGDGVSDIDINKLALFHKKQGTLATITGVRPYSKYGLIKVSAKNGLATEFRQKPLVEFRNEFIGGGFMIFNKKVLDFLDNGPMENMFPKLISKKQLSVYQHKGFWMAMDTYLEAQELNKLWDTSKPWAVWQQN